MRYVDTMHRISHMINYRSQFPKYMYKELSVCVAVVGGDVGEDAVFAK